MDRGDLADLTAFVAVADHLSFRAAASQLGVTPSALSHSMRQLEERLGVRLLHRTTRSVSLTDAGLRLLERLRPAIDQIAGALEDLNQERQRPLGRLRIYAIHMAAAAVDRAGLGTLLVDVPGSPPRARRSARRRSTSWRRDSTPGSDHATGCAADMIAVRVMGPMKVAVVGAPTYFAKRRPPRTPDDLARHSCVQYRSAADGDRIRCGRSSGTANRGGFRWMAG